MIHPKPAEHIVVFTPESELRAPIRLLRHMIRDLWSARELGWILALRDIRVQYSQSVLGLFWMFVVPAAHILLWLFIHSIGAVEFRTGEVSYAVFVITGVMLWSIFMDAVNAPLQQAVAAKPMLSKISFPREALVLSGILQSLFAAAIKLVILLPVLFWLGIPVSAGLPMLPMVVAALVIAGTLLGVALTPAGLLYTDVGRGLPLLLQSLMYLSPVVYPAPVGTWAARYIEWNPMTTLVEFSRSVVLTGQLAGLGDYLQVVAVMLAALMVVLVLLRSAWPILIERMGA
jgi:lipopolysaccharide transport system permease protein